MHETVTILPGVATGDQAQQGGKREAAVLTLLMLPLRPVQQPAAEERGERPSRLPEPRWSGLRRAGPTLQPVQSCLMARKPAHRAGWQRSSHVATEGRRPSGILLLRCTASMQFMLGKTIHISTTLDCVHTCHPVARQHCMHAINAW